MRRLDVALLLGLGIGVILLEAPLVASPGYMDSDYYLATGLGLAAGGGFQEPFLWNYLDDPDGIPHASHSYWMPLVSLVAALGVRLFGEGFHAARVPFLAVASLLPAVGFATAIRLGAERREAWLSALLASAGGFYAPYWLTTDAFGIFAAVGGLLWILLGTPARRPLWPAVGALVGAAHLARADGILLLVPVFLAAWRFPGSAARACILVLIGYGLVMAPWMARNLNAFGSLWPPGGDRVLWLRGYDELFSFPATILQPGRWWAQGVGVLAGQRLTALWDNLQSLVVANASVFLLPLAAAGVWNRRRSAAIGGALGYLAGLLLVMSIVFPFAGGRGGFFHSSAALMPALWAAAPLGLKDLLAWGARARHWDPRLGWRLLGGAAVLFSAALTGYVFWARVVGPDPSLPLWSASARTYDRLQEGYFDRRDPGRAAVNNPPGFHLATNRQAIVIPDGGPSTLRAAVRAYHVAWVVLDANHPAGLRALYDSPQSTGWLTWQATIADANGQPVHIFRVHDGP